jgi:hypothetical protein
MKYKKFFRLAAPLLLFSLLIPAGAYSQDDSSCIVCHTAMEGRLKTASGNFIELNVDAEKFKESVHGSFSCTDCHMRFTSDPHTSPDAAVPPSIQSIANAVSEKYPIDSVAGAACSMCHDEVYQKVLNSMHGKNVVEKHQKDGALCLDCHGSPHYIVPSDNPESPISRENQVETCGKCHGDEKIIEKYKLQGNVMKSFKESFHGRKLHLGHTKAPVCSSCHNSHDIKSKDDPTSPVYGDNKLETCGKCHEGANKTFVPAITHQPPGPIPHYAEKALILLLLSVFAFIIIHVILEAFSDIRDAIFRKGRKE